MAQSSEGKGSMHFTSKAKKHEWVDLAGLYSMQGGTGES